MINLDLGQIGEYYGYSPASGVANGISISCPYASKLIYENDANLDEDIQSLRSSCISNVEYLCSTVTEASSPYSCVSTTEYRKSFFESVSVAYMNTEVLVALLIFASSLLLVLAPRW